MPEPTDTLPSSPALLDGPLPSILGDEDDDGGAAVLLGETDEQAEETAEAVAEDKGEENGEESTPDPDQIDKGLQQRQQNLANREKAVLAAEKKIEATTERLDKLLARFEANPTAANAAAVEKAQEQAQSGLAEVEALLADPKYDPYADSGKVIKSLVATVKRLETEQNSLKTKTATTDAEREESKRHEAFWANFGTRNPVIGRKLGEDLWSQAGAQAKAEAQKLSEEGIPTSELEAAKQIFHRLVSAERAKKAAPATRQPSPAATGGRLGPTTGRAGSAPGKPKGLDERVKAGEFNLSGSFT